MTVPVLENPPQRPPLLTRVDKWWAVCFVLTLIILWPLPFLFGLSPRTIGSVAFVALMAWLFVPLTLLLGYLLVAVTSPFVGEVKERRMQRLLSRLGLLLFCAFVAAAVNYSGGGPISLGRLFAAKWGIGLRQS